MTIVSLTVSDPNNSLRHTWKGPKLKGKTKSCIVYSQEFLIIMRLIGLPCIYKMSIISNQTTALIDLFCYKKQYRLKWIWSEVTQIWKNKIPIKQGFITLVINSDFLTFTFFVTLIYCILKKYCGYC